MSANLNRCPVTGKILGATQEQRDAMVAAYLSGMSMKKAATMFGFSRMACTRAVEAAGISKRHYTGGPRKARVAKATKGCRDCKRDLPVNRFNAHPQCADGLQPYCNDCRRERARTWRAANRDKERERHRRVYRGNPEARRAAVRKSHEKHREKRRFQAKVYEQAHPEKARQRTARRKARKRAAQVGKVNYDAVVARDGMFCYLCQKTVEREQLVFEHVVPLCRGGAHSMENIRVAHHACNTRKGRRLLSELDMSRFV